MEDNNKINNNISDDLSDETDVIREGAKADCTDCDNNNCSYDCECNDACSINDKKVTELPVGKRVATAAIDLADIVCSAIFLMLVLFMFVFKYVTVVGNSMYPTLHNTDRLIITSLFYTPKQGDIVVIDVPNEDEPLIKRVIATEGQVISLDSETWTVYIDGVPLEENYEINKTSRPMYLGGLQFPYTVEKGKIFVMGDNRNDSKDSRMIGTIEVSKILGKVAFRLYPTEKIGTVK